jgi:CO/xanthine dehydrogenase FAD-binding subunit
MASYVRPRTLDEALRARGERACTILAGGTDFYPARVGRVVDEDILDLTAVAGLRGIRDEGVAMRIGALTTWTDLLEADLPGWCGGLKLAAREIGGVQIQNAGTIAGNLCNASPAADGVPPLLALDAAVELRSARGMRRLPVGEFVLGNRRTACAHDELVTAVIVPKWRDPARATFLKLGARKYLVISIVMVAAAVEVAADGTVARCAIAVGACSPVAQRLRDLERDLTGRRLERGIGGAVETRHLAPLGPISDIRGSADYRRDAVATLVARALERLA